MTSNRSIFSCNIQADSFLKAVFDGDLNTIGLYIEQNRGNTDAINTTDKDGRTALIIAAMRNHPAIIRALLNTPGINVNATYTHLRMTALMLACSNRNEDATQELLQSDDIDVNMTTTHGFTALHFSIGTGIYSNDATIINYLLAHRKINIDAVSAYGETVMDIARNGHPNILRALQVFSSRPEYLSRP